MRNHAQTTQDKGRTQEQLWNDFAKQRNPLQAHQEEGHALRQAVRRSILLVLLCLVSVGLLLLTVRALLQLLPILRVAWWSEWDVWLFLLFSGLLLAAAFAVGMKELLLSWRRATANRHR